MTLAGGAELKLSSSWEAQKWDDLFGATTKVWFKPHWGGATKKSAIFELPSEGGSILPIFCVVRRSRTSRYASLLSAL